MSARRDAAHRPHVQADEEERACQECKGSPGNCRWPHTKRPNHRCVHSTLPWWCSRCGTWKPRAELIQDRGRLVCVKRCQE